MSELQLLMQMRKAKVRILKDVTNEIEKHFVKIKNEYQKEKENITLSQFLKRRGFRLRKFKFSQLLERYPVMKEKQRKFDVDGIIWQLRESTLVMNEKRYYVNNIGRLVETCLMDEGIHCPDFIMDEILFLSIVALVNDGMLFKEYIEKKKIPDFTYRPFLEMCTYVSNHGYCIFKGKKYTFEEKKLKWDRSFSNLGSRIVQMDTVMIRTLGIMCDKNDKVIKMVVEAFQLLGGSVFSDLVQYVLDAARYYWSLNRYNTLGVITVQGDMYQRKEDEMQEIYSIESFEKSEFQRDEVFKKFMIEKIPDSEWFVNYDKNFFCKQLYEMSPEKIEGKQDVCRRIRYYCDSKNVYIYNLNETWVLCDLNIDITVLSKLQRCTVTLVSEEGQFLSVDVEKKGFIKQCNVFSTFFITSVGYKEFQFIDVKIEQIKKLDFLCKVQDNHTVQIEFRTLKDQFLIEIPQDMKSVCTKMIEIRKFNTVFEDLAEINWVTSCDRFFLLCRFSDQFRSEIFDQISIYISFCMKYAAPIFHDYSLVFGKNVFRNFAYLKLNCSEERFFFEGRGFLDVYREDRAFRGIHL